MDEIKLESLRAIEKSLVKRYRKDIWANFIKAIREFKLIDSGDKIAVAISGGKDSLLLAKLLQELSKHNNQNFEVEYIAMDPGFTEYNRKKLEYICEYLNIPVKIYNSDIFEVADKLNRDNPCYMCARMRRGFLYSKAKELGCNKLALGHHFNDVIETTLLNVLCGGMYKTMLPKLKSDNFEDMELIRPLYHVREKDIIRWLNYTKIEALDCACTVATKDMGSKRAEIKKLIEDLQDTFTNVDISIFRSAENVNLEGILGWKKEGNMHSFLDDY